VQFLPIVCKALFKPAKNHTCPAHEAKGFLTEQPACFAFEIFDDLFALQAQNLFTIINH